MQPLKKKKIQYPLEEKKPTKILLLDFLAFITKLPDQSKAYKRSF